MNILLTGASGFIGRNIVAALSADGHTVTPISRSQGINFCQMQAPADWLPHLAGIDAIINSVGIIGESASQRFEVLHRLAPIALFRACVAAGVRRVLQISALGADESAFSAYHLSKRAADNYLRSLDLDWFVLRPSLIYGHGGKSAELFMRLAALPLIPVIADGQQALQPIHISDVVASVKQSLRSSTTKQTLDLVGDKTIPFVEWLQMMRQAQGLARARIVRIPYPLTRLGRYFSPLLQAENLRMLKAGYGADVQPLAQFLGRMPLTVESSLFFPMPGSQGAHHDLQPYQNATHSEHGALVRHGPRERLLQKDGRPLRQRCAYRHHQSTCCSGGLAFHHADRALSAHQRPVDGFSARSAAAHTLGSGQPHPVCFGRRLLATRRLATDPHAKNIRRRPRP